jgi:hypothetical protein
MMFAFAMKAAIRHRASLPRPMASTKYRRAVIDPLVNPGSRRIASDLLEGGSEPHTPPSCCLAVMVPVDVRSVNRSI